MDIQGLRDECAKGGRVAVDAADMSALLDAWVERRALRAKLRRWRVRRGVELAQRAALRDILQPR